jgi:hypothetical protein
MGSRLWAMLGDRHPTLWLLYILLPDLYDVGATNLVSFGWLEPTSSYRNKFDSIVPSACPSGLLAT